MWNRVEVHSTGERHLCSSKSGGLVTCLYGTLHQHTEDCTCSSSFSSSVTTTSSVFVTEEKTNKNNSEPVIHRWSNQSPLLKFWPVMGRLGVTLLLTKYEGIGWWTLVEARVYQIKTYPNTICWHFHCDNLRELGSGPLGLKCSTWIVIYICSKLEFHQNNTVHVKTQLFFFHFH